VDRFGESAPAPDVYKFLGIDAEHLVAAVKRVV
jgi:transketolase